ncbi:MAG: hypothetical protein KatS3mg029_0611 [Saprospiraceae bacterium]|nr:MAG: hypothetical protein KatS3mg029_0611 [Saprospiraceae bacterium]
MKHPWPSKGDHACGIGLYAICPVTFSRAKYQNASLQILEL